MLAACLCFKDSADYLDEWLRFHYVQGFRKFYLYDNGSSDDWRSVVEPWIASGIVEATCYPGCGVQAQIYDDCLARARGNVRWLAFLDDDEFLYASGGASLPTLLSEFDSHAGLAVSWLLYGSSGQERRREGWVIDRFLFRHPTPDRHVKCVVQPHRTVSSRVIGHCFTTSPPYHIVDECHRPLNEPLNLEPTAARIRINHYLVKSWEEWRLRRLRPQANTGAFTPHPESAWREWDSSWSVHFDSSAQAFSAEMNQVILKTQGSRSISSK